MTYVRELVRHVVVQEAPHEVPVLDSLRDFDDDRALRVLNRTGQKQEPLGFGYAEAAAVVTPVVWMVLDQVVRHTVDRASDTVLTRGRERVSRLLRRNPAEANRVMTVLDAGQLATVRTHVRDRAKERGMPDAAAEALADSVVARIAISQDTPQDSTPRPAAPHGPTPPTGQPAHQPAERPGQSGAAS
ncbi:hypothetical protein [Streptomyces sp. NPDC006012]|uniref:hypothetical protein n=1 Tax=Streptomyces sp. NPDC006012 TaxID=3364739 RepID=UPI00367652CB